MPTARIRVLVNLTAILVIASVAAPAACDPADAHWQTGYHHAGVQGTVYSMLSTPGALYVGGYITAVQDVPVLNVARLTTSGGLVTGAEALGAGLDGNVRTLCEHDGDIIAGGGFSISGPLAVENVARWNGTMWRPLGLGLAGVPVYAVASYDGKIYAAGYRFDGASWSDVMQTNGTVRTLTVHDGLLYVGGDFTEAGGQVVNHVFAWDGTQIIPLGDGLSEAVVSADAFAGGAVFVAQNDSGVAVVERWDGMEWHLERENTLVDTVVCVGTGLLVSESIYMGGSTFRPSITDNSGGIWTTVGDFDSRVMAVHEGMVLLDANEGDVPGVLTPGLVGWDGLVWQNAFASDEGFDNAFECLATSESILVAGGDFVIANGQEVDGVAFTNGDAWAAYGGRLDLDADSDYTVFADLELIGSGAFGVCMITDYDVGYYRPVELVMDSYPPYWRLIDASGWCGDDLVVVGSDPYGFCSYGDVNEVFELNPDTGATTAVPGLDLDDDIRGCFAYLDNIAIWGEFTTNGGEPVNCVMRHNGTFWQDVGERLPGIHFEMIVPIDGIRLAAAVRTDDYVRKVAVFDGADWALLDGDFDYAVSALVWHRDRLFVGGGFDTIGDVEAHGIAMWTGDHWTPVGSGLVSKYSWSRVGDLASFDDALWAVGGFTEAGGRPAAGIAEWTGDPASLTWPPAAVEDTPPALPRLLRVPVPNPFNPSTTIAFDMPDAARVRIGIYDFRGARLRSLVDEHREAGSHALVWDGRDDAGHALPAGVYFARLEIAGRGEAVKLTLVK